MTRVDVLVVGAGFSGTTAARILAEAGRRVYVIGRRRQVGADNWETGNRPGVRVHACGSHAATSGRPFTRPPEARVTRGPERLVACNGGSGSERTRHGAASRVECKAPLRGNGRPHCKQRQRRNRRE